MMATERRKRYKARKLAERVAVVQREIERQRQAAWNEAVERQRQRAVKAQRHAG
jgi:hypothetical protein